MKTKIKVVIQTLNHKQIDTLAKLANLDARAMERSWKLSKFDAELSHKRTHGMGAFDPMGNLLAYAIYDVADDNSILVVRLVVSPDHRRMGFATRLMDQLRALSRMMHSAIPKLVVEVSEDDVEAWKFFREYGRRSGIDVKTYLVKNNPDDYFGFTFHTKEQIACAS